MLNRLIFLCIAIVFLMAIPLEAAYLHNIPQTLVQPNGDTVYCFASGDEFFHWLHDENNFTIVKDPSTGYWVYAKQTAGKIVPSSYIFGIVDPVKVSLQPGLKISKEEYLLRRAAFFEGVEPGKAPHAGTINNLCIFIRFSEETEFTNSRSFYDHIFNSFTSGDNSMRNYFREVSYNQLTISTTFYPVCGLNTNLSYLDAYSRGYYQPWSEYNPIGYHNLNEMKQREHTLLKNAVNFVKAQIPTDLIIDGDDDGKVDNVCFFVRGQPDGWNDLLWPKQWVLSSYNVYINGKRVYDYNLQLEAYSYNGTLCHEMCHSLGFPDLYHYSYDGFVPVGPWDIMEYNYDPPEHMGAYMKYRYGEWISSLLEVWDGGYYTLNSLTTDWWNSWKIRSNVSSSQYFVVEYRRKVGTFEGSLPGSGLLVYRINTKEDGKGNREGPPDEVYIYRPDGTPDSNGHVWDAYFTADVGRMCMNNLTNPSGFLSDGSLGNLFIADIGPATDNSISFFVALSWRTLFGMIYDGQGGPLLRGEPDTYWLTANTQVPSGKTLTVKNGARLYSQPGAMLTSAGRMNFEAGSKWTRFFTLSRCRAGIKSRGQIRMTNGGTIKFN